MLFEVRLRRAASQLSRFRKRRGVEEAVATVQIRARIREEARLSSMTVVPYKPQYGKQPRIRKMHEKKKNGKERERASEREHTSAETAQQTRGRPRHATPRVQPLSQVDVQGRPRYAAKSIKEKASTEINNKNKGQTPVIHVSGSDTHKNARMQ